ncbi:unnamed protein product [Ectocarpus sp. CCAP 1310/34]|nr:unnamed protein product [Ectocarpus sp. CCAP 1310/34]
MADSTSDGVGPSSGLAPEGAGWGSFSFEEARQQARASSSAMLRHVLRPRDLVLLINSHVGALSRCFSRRPADCAVGLPHFTRTEKDVVVLEMGSAAACLLLLAERCNVDLGLSVDLKVKLNAKKYPAVLVRGSALKYDAYKTTTGFAKGSRQDMTEGDGGDDHLSGCNGRAWRPFSLQDLRVQLQNFCTERNWQKFHTPRNICLALMGEAGELSELFQFKDEDTCCQGLPSWSRDDRDKLSQEMADVFIYVTRLADLCGVDLCAVLQDDPLSRSHSMHRAPSTNYREELCANNRRWGLATCVLVGLTVLLTTTNKRLR